MSNTVIQLKKSGITGNVPGSLSYGELALNYFDGKLFYKNSSNTISYFKNTDSFATISANGELILATSPTDILSIIPGQNIGITACTANKSITINAVKDISSVVNFTTVDTKNYTADTNQVSFNVNYTSPNIMVFINGIKIDNSEYIATNGSSITLLVPCNTGDIVDLVGITVNSTFDTTLTIANTTQSTSTTTGAVVINGGVGIGKNLFVDGTIKSNKSLIRNFKSISSNTSLDDTYDVISATGNSAITITLPSASSNTGLCYTIDNNTTGYIRIDTTSSQKINNENYQLIPSDSCIIVISNGSNWRII